MKSKNMLIIMVDELATKAVGCYGSSIAKTPNIDRLAQQGVRFTNAYATSPICVPARASFATGQYPYQTGYWDNVFAYDGRVKGWGHRLQDAGHRFTTIGKLHYKGADYPLGIDEQIIPMHLYRDGDKFGLERENPPKRPQTASLSQNVLVGDSHYTKYDKQITAMTEDWFENRMCEQGDKPWVLFTSFVAPHFPLTVPQEYINLYDLDDIQIDTKQLNYQGDIGKWWKKFRSGYAFDDYFKDDTHRRQALLHYYALCSFVDAQVGKVLTALEHSGQADNTTILFMSDHGDNLGARGLWGKSTMWEESVKIPMIMVDLHLTAGTDCRTPVSFVDIYQTVLECVGIPLNTQEKTLPGTSLMHIAKSPYDPERQVFCEYHAACATTGLMMLRKGAYKYVYYTDHGAELYNIDTDAQELYNLSCNPEYEHIMHDFETALYNFVNPQVVDAHAKSDQKRRLQELGGLDTVLSQGGLAYTPPPGDKAKAWL